MSAVLESPSNRVLWLVWGYLLLIVAAEVVTSFVYPQAGLLLHSTAIVGLTLYAGFGTNADGRKLALALIVAPLIRILSLSLPLRSFPLVAWFPIVAIPLLVTVWIIVRHIGISRLDLGLRRDNVFLQVMLAGIGLPLGVIEYAILHPAPMVSSFSWQTVSISMVSLTVFTGFMEELVFRGLLQSLALRMLGRWALIYVSLLFAALHIGYRSASDVIFVFAVGLAFAYIVYWSGSILGVTLAHGVTNATLFLGMPFLAREVSSTAHVVAVAALAVTWLLTTVASVALCWRAWRNGRLTVQDWRKEDTRPGESKIPLIEALTS